MSTTIFLKQLLDEVEHDIMNYQNRGLCYQRREVLIIHDIMRKPNSIIVFTMTAEIQARSLANFYCQYADRHVNLEFMRRVSEREQAIRQFVIVKNKLMSVFNASVLLLIMNFVITLSK